MFVDKIDKLIKTDP